VKSNFKWQLINDSITDSDKKALTDFINTPNQRFTQGKKVKEFEEEWSKWEGVKYSTFVNSGASANYIMTSIMKEKKGVGEVIVSPLGWVSDVSPLVNLGFTPVFVDVSLSNMSISLENIKNAITDKTVGICLVHVLGFSAINDELVKFAKDNDLFLIEDCCESHGATHKDNLGFTSKVGTFGDISNFSFYFGHHITTVEGGMVCTNDNDIHQLARAFRSHGMTRELSDEVQNKYKKEYPNLNPLFTFAVPGYNMRNQEINAVLGLEQLKRLDYNIWNRQDNFRLWVSCLDPIKYQVSFQEEGNSNFSLPLIILNSNKLLFEGVCRILDEEEVEYRIGTAGGGNQARQPYLEKYEFRAHDLTNVDYIHDFGLYVGNHPELDKEEIIKLCDRLNLV
jgi:CDP-6-deoxy-D-xylo-4-hexulose-3-dehydrase|tara:strand:- start:359 stop:1543 length:1185 start_codon:yes stop_codon:yes gene_type:complete